MSNFRAIDSLLQEAFTGLQVYCSQFSVSHWFSSFVQQRNSKRADRALQTQVPHINAELEESMESLTQLSQTLPKIQSQVVDIRVVHDSGREKVCLFPTSRCLCAETVKCFPGSSSSRRPGLAQHRIL